jgi:hypothetical protein
MDPPDLDRYPTLSQIQEQKQFFHKCSFFINIHVARDKVMKG